MSGLKIIDLQGCAYALAHNEMFESKIRQVAILMVDREGNYADFVIKDEEFDEYCNKWADLQNTIQKY